MVNGDLCSLHVASSLNDTPPSFISIKWISHRSTVRILFSRSSTKTVSQGTNGSPVCIASIVILQERTDHYQQVGLESVGVASWNQQMLGPSTSRVLEEIAGVEVVGS